jgi:hypothetical protein
MLAVYRWAYMDMVPKALVLDRDGIYLSRTRGLAPETWR